MKKKRSIVIMAGLLIAVLLVGAGIPLYIASNHKKEEAEVAAAEANRGLGKYSEYELFQKVPVMAKKDVIYTEAAEVGGGDYLITAENTLLKDYQDYLSVLEDNGFNKIWDNGENGIEGFVYTAHYQKEDLLVIVSHIVNLEKTTITATENTVLSERLFYDEAAATASGQTGAKTKLHVYEMKNSGMGFLFQLKNGHFLLYDGGRQVELPYLVEYMESLVPAGQKPVIDAWFISHAHSDHMGILNGFVNDKSYVERVAIESIYFTEPSKEALDLNGSTDSVPGHMLFCKNAAEYVKNSEGTKPEMYRPRTGERYYFGDIAIDIIYTPELSPAEDWDTWNSSSIVMMVIIEGQKVLLTGDTDWSSQLVYTDMYDKEYFDLTVYQVPHHGINVYRQMTNRLGTIRTAVYPSKVLGSDNTPSKYVGRKPQNEHLKSIALEALTWGQGTKILTFPYEIGTSETLPQKFVTEK